MGNETTYSGVIGELTRFSAAMAANAAELPHLEGPRIRLDTILGNAQQTARQQAALTADKQETSKRLKSLVVEGQRVASGIRRLLKENYGNRSEKLAEFGVQPFRGRTLKAKTGTPSPTPTPVPTPTPTTTAPATAADVDAKL
jgi:hypothetical protein